jgi:lipopolysaccharide biosynthesis protein
MALKIAYKIPLLSRALRQRDQARLDVEEAQRKQGEVCLLPLLGEDPTVTPWRELRPPVLTGGLRVCLYVCFARDNRIASHAIFAMKAARADGIYVVCIAVKEYFDGPFVDPGPEIADALCVRANKGWDFAAWAATLKRYPQLWEQEALLFMNDSVIGPIRPMSELWKTIHGAEAAAFGMTESIEVRRHIQSYWMYFKRSALENKKFRLYWDGIMNLENKLDVILCYETTLTYYCEDIGINVGCLFEYRSEGVTLINPTHVQWLKLLERGFPFIKTNLLRENPQRIDISSWVSQVLRLGLDGRLVQRLLEPPAL